jgi:hypothetical protein
MSPRISASSAVESQGAFGAPLIRPLRGRLLPQWEKDYCRAISASPIASPSSSWSGSMVTVTFRKAPVKAKGAA